MRHVVAKRRHGAAREENGARRCCDRGEGVCGGEQKVRKLDVWVLGLRLLPRVEDSTFRAQVGQADEERNEIMKDRS